MNYIIATSRVWYEWLPEKLTSVTGESFVLVKSEKDLEVSCLEKLNPRYIFFPHWSYLIPAAIYDNFECVIFHMTDVPFGRGGSPLQNLIAMGIYETRISAIKCSQVLDGGPVFLKKPFSLYGSAEEIYIRASELIYGMIIEIVEKGIEPVNQTGEVVCFKRREPEEGNILSLKELKEIYDYIRMLDADGYPRAFAEAGDFRFEFQRASLKHNKIIADVIITLRGNEE